MVQQKKLRILIMVSTVDGKMELLLVQNLHQMVFREDMAQYKELQNLTLVVSVDDKMELLSVQNFHQAVV